MPKKKEEWPIGWTVAEAKKLLVGSDGSGLHGGHIKDIPPPIIRFFDDKRRKREVRVNITVFDAFALGVHFHVDMWEQNDSILDRRRRGSYCKKPGWRECWDDQEGKGRGFHDKFDTPEQAAHFVINTWNEEFSKKTHRLSLEHMRDSVRAIIVRKFKDEAR